MPGATRAFVGGLDRIFTLLAWVSAAMAAVMMFTTFANVIMRYLFRHPIPGAFEIIEITMGLIVFFALPKMIRIRGNIRVTVVFDRFAPTVRAWATFATEWLGAAISLLIAWRMWLYGERILTYGEVTMELRIPKGLIAQSMAALLVVAALAFAICAVEALKDEGAPGAGEAGL